GYAGLSVPIVSRPAPTRWSEAGAQPATPLVTARSLAAGRASPAAVARTAAAAASAINVFRISLPFSLVTEVEVPRLRRCSPAKLAIVRVSVGRLLVAARHIHPDDTVGPGVAPRPEAGCRGFT